MKKVVKQVYDLTESDLKDYPLWIYLSEDDDGAIDEASVQSGTEQELSQTMSMYVAIAEFKLANGKTLCGYVCPEEELPDSQPLIFVGEQKFNFWEGMSAPDELYLRSFYNALGLERLDVFPIKWDCKYVLPGWCSSGVITGFGFISDNGQINYVT